MSRNTRRRLIAYPALLLAYGLMMFPLGCGKYLADRVLLHPSTGPVPTYGATPRYHDTPVGTVEVYVARSPSSIGRRPERFVLRLMGNGSRAEREATANALRWSDVPTEVWALNYPGYGKSDGPAALGKLLPSARSVWATLHDEAGGRLCYIDGDSMGTAVSLRLAAMERAERPVAGLVLKNPPPLRRLVLGRFGWWNLWLLAGPVASAIPAELNSIDNARQSHAPAIFLRATGDDLIPPDYQRFISDDYAGLVEVLELDGANHNTPMTGDEESRLRDLIATHLTRD